MDALQIDWQPDMTSVMTITPFTQEMCVYVFNLPGAYSNATRQHLHMNECRHQYTKTHTTSAAVDYNVHIPAKKQSLHNKDNTKA